MKKLKNTKLILIILGMVLLVCTPIITYALNVPVNNVETNEESFFSSDKTEASPGDVVTMSINLDKVNYDDFKFTLSSNNGLSNIVAPEKTEINSSVENNEFYLTSSKSDLNIEKISLSYTIPNDAEIGTVIELKARIENNAKKEIKSEDVENNVEEEIEINQAESQVEEENQNTDFQETTISIKIVEKKEEEDKKDETNMNIENFSSDEKNNKDSNLENNQNSEKLSNQSTLMQSSGSQSGINQSSTSVGTQVSEGETVTYNGESNNYLSSLSVNGYEIEPSFCKTNSTYFITVDDSVTTLEINATTEDENATISIYGNEDLQDGENKVLISVTAENGNVRTYRIYVSK